MWCKCGLWSLLLLFPVKLDGIRVVLALSRPLRRWSGIALRTIRNRSSLSCPESAEIRKIASACPEKCQSTGPLCGNRADSTINSLNKCKCLFIGALFVLLRKVRLRFEPRVPQKISWSALRVASAATERARQCCLYLRPPSKASLRFKLRLMLNRLCDLRRLVALRFASRPIFWFDSAPVKVLLIWRKYLISRFDLPAGN